MFGLAKELQQMEEPKEKPIDPTKKSKKGNRKPKMRTVQVSEDVAFWASLLAELEESTMWEILDPVRGILREQLKTDHGLDPDEEFQRLLRSRSRRNEKGQQS